MFLLGIPFEPALAGITANIFILFLIKSYPMLIRYLPKDLF